MKKLIAVLLMITLLASLSVCAFAADSTSSTTDKTKVESPVQEGSKSSGGGDEPAVGGGAAAKEPTQEVKLIAAIAAEDVAAADEDGNEVAVEVSEDAEGAEDAAAALSAKNIAAALTGDAAKKADGMNLAATTPVCVESETYPCKVTLPIDDLDTFVCVLLIADGEVTAPEMDIDEEASTVTITLEKPAFISMVYTNGEVAA